MKIKTQEHINHRPKVITNSTALRRGAITIFFLKHLQKGSILILGFSPCVYRPRKPVCYMSKIRRNSQLRRTPYQHLNLLSPAFSKKSGSSFRPSFRPPPPPPPPPHKVVGTLCAHLLLQFYADSLQMFLSWSLFCFDCGLTSR